jgi:Acyl-CoA carboxylase epsilon subunit
MTSGQVEVRGNATAEELAVVLSLLAGRATAGPESTGYERWRRTRECALRRISRRSR